MLLKLIFSFLNIASRKLKMRYVSHIMFLLDSAIPESAISFSFRTFTS